MKKKSEWIRVSTAAKHRGVTRQVIYWHIKEGNLTPTMELDGNKYVDMASLLNWRRKGKGEYKKREKVGL